MITVRVCAQCGKDFAIRHSAKYLPLRQNCPKCRDKGLISSVTPSAGAKKGQRRSVTSRHWKRVGKDLADDILRNPRR
jgi:DNA-directed RNA polymerase subunit RPC12/RpoP